MIMKLSVSTKILGIGALLPAAFVALGLIIFLQLEKTAAYVTAEKEANDMLTAVADTRDSFLLVNIQEKTFLLTPNDGALRRHGDFMQRGKASLDRMENLLTTAEEKTTVTELRGHLAEYERAFGEMVAASRTLGFNENSGLQGALRKSVQDLETRMLNNPDASYRADILTLRRREKDFLLRVEDRYRQTLNTEAQALRGRMERDGMGDALPLLDAYVRDFNAYVDIRLNLNRTMQRTDAAGLAMTPLLDRLFDYNQKEAIDARAKADQVRAAAFRQIFGFMIVVALIGFALAVLIGRGIARPLSTMIAIMNRLSTGEFRVEVPQLKRRDEIAEMAAALGVFRQNAEERHQMQESERARVDAERRQEAAQREKDARIAAEIAAFCTAVLQGDLGQRLSEVDKDGVLLELSRQLNTLAGTLGGMTGEIATVAGAMADGRLTLSVNGDYRGVFGDLKTGINGMSAKLRDFAGRLAHTTEAVNAASAEISSGSQDLAQRTESQAASIEETAASMHEITTTVKQNADNAAAASHLATAARDTADTGGAVVQKAVAAVSQIEQSSQRITDIVSLIDEIAFQTNLLALNASVEAARAGEAGKGFAVVAQEVRALAQRSASASKEIKTLISETNAQVKTGAALVNQAGGSLVDIVNSIKKVADIVSEISLASREQATGLDQINTAVGQMDEMTQRNSALVEETTASAQSLAGQARELAEMVRFFRV